MMRDLLKEIQVAIDRRMLPLRRSIRRGILRTVSTTFFGQIDLTTNDEDLHPDIELWQHYGFASLPPADSEALVVHPYAAPEGAICCATNNRDHRPTLNAGDAAIYSEASGSDQAAAIARQDGDLELQCAVGKFVEVGGDSEKLLLGETVKGDLNTFLTDTWASLPTGTAVQNAAVLAALQASAATLADALSGWLATKGKVS